MATEISLELPTRGISWKGKLYESQLASLLKPFTFLQEKITAFQESVRATSPSLSEDEVLEAANQDFFSGIFGGSDQQLSFSIVQLFREIYPSDIVDSFYKLEEAMDLVDGVLVKKGFEIRWRLDAAEFAELFQQLTLATQAISAVEEKPIEPPKTKKKGFTKKPKGAEDVPVIEETSVAVEAESLDDRIAAENARTLELQKLRARLDALTSGRADTEDAELVDLEVV